MNWNLRGGAGTCPAPGPPQGDCAAQTRHDPRSRAPAAKDGASSYTHAIRCLGGSRHPHAGSQGHCRVAGADQQHRSAQGGTQASVRTATAPAAQRRDASAPGVASGKRHPSEGAGGGGEGPTAAGDGREAGGRGTQPHSRERGCKWHSLMGTTRFIYRKATLRGNLKRRVQEDSTSPFWKN